MNIKHLHILIRAECSKSPGATDEKTVENKVTQLIKDIGMCVFLEPKAKYMADAGNSGLTYCAGLETSHTAAHFFDEASDDIMNYKGHSLLQKCLYTCGDLSTSQIQTILRFISEYEPKHFNAVLFNRSKSLIKPEIILEWDTKDGQSFEDFIKSINVDKKNKIAA